jgi:hypothetical protein
MYKTIGIGGQLGSGKDTVADYLVIKLREITKTRWKRNAFANKVKEVFEMSFDKDRLWVEKWKRLDEVPPGFDQTCRQCLIGIGDGFRKMKSDIWIEFAFRNQDCHQVISDARYVNEMDYIRHEKGGIGVLLWRSGYENNLPNASEQEYMPFVRKCLDGNLNGNLPSDMPFDYFLRNDGSTDDLYRRIDTQLVPYILSRWKFQEKPVGVEKCMV